MAPADDPTGGSLAIFVGSANVGNAEPTPASFAHWVPADGDIDAPLASTKYPVAAPGSTEAVASLRGQNKKFDIIVLGMQEAAFVEKSVKRKSSLDGPADGSTGEEREGAGIPVVDEVVEAATTAVAELEKEGKKGRRKLTKKLVQGSMMIRGLTAAQTYKA